MYAKLIKRSLIWALFMTALVGCIEPQSQSNLSTNTTPLVSYQSRPFQPFAFKSNELWANFKHDSKMDAQVKRPEVQKQIKRYQRQRKLLSRDFIRAKPYMYYIYQQVQKRKLPIEVALLPIVESDFNPFAYSRVGAAGLWQMMPGTASGYGIQQNWWYDGRRDIFVSTQAALDHLAYLNKYFKGNILLAFAAYDAGRGRIDRAKKKNKTKGKAADFWSLPLPRETKIYIPRMLALVEIVRHPSKYGVTLPKTPFKPYLTRINVKSQIDLAEAAKLADIKLQTLYQLNPGFNRWATDPNGSHHLVLPISNAERFKQRLAAIPKHQRVSWKHYKVKSGDTLSGIAYRYKTRVALLKQVNKLKSNTLRINQELLIPKKTKMLVADHGNTKSKPKPLTIPKGRGPKQIVYTVKSGDSLASIASKYRMKIAEVKFWNRVKLSRGLQPGMKLVLWRNKRRPTTGQTLYKVKAGDTFWKIARQYHVKTKDLQRWNNKRSVKLRIGERLVIYRKSVV